MCFTLWGLVLLLNTVNTVIGLEDLNVIQDQWVEIIFFLLSDKAEHHI